MDFVHHVVPLATCNLVVIFVTKFSSPTEAEFHLVRPFVGTEILTLCIITIHRHRIIHVIKVAEHTHRMVNQFIVSISVLHRHQFTQDGRVALQLVVFRHTLLPFARKKVKRTGIQLLRGATMCILALQIQNAGSLLGALLAKLLTAEVLRVFHQIASIELCGVPCHLEPEINRELHRFQVTHIENPEFIHTISISELQLLPHTLHLADILKFRVTWRTHIVHVVIHAVTARMTLGESACTLVPLLFRQHTHIAPVVVTEQQNHIVWHIHALLVILLHFLIERPHLRRFLGWLACRFFYQFALIRHDAFQQCHISMVTHRLVTITTHTNRHHIISVLHTLYTTLPEFVQCFLVGIIVPCTIFPSMACPLLVCTCQRFMVAGTHTDAHVIGGLHVQWVVRIEHGIPHGRPHEVSFQPQHQFKHAGIKLMVIPTIILFHPTCQTRSLIIEEDATIAHRWFTIRIDTLLHIKVCMFFHRDIRPIIPRTHTNLL